MNRIKLHVRKGDNVEVIARKQRVLIEGVRMIKRHLKKSQDNPQGKIAEREGPIHISNVKVLEHGERAAKGKGKGKGKKKTTKEKASKSKSPKEKDAKEE